MSDIKKLLTIVDKVEKPVAINEAASLRVVSKDTTEKDIANLVNKVTSLSGMKPVTNEMVNQKTAPKSMFQTIADVGRYAESAAKEYKKKLNEWDTDPDHEDSMRDEAVEAAIESILKELGMNPSEVFGSKMTYDQANELAQKIEKASGRDYYNTGPDLSADTVLDWFEKRNQISDIDEEWSNAPDEVYKDPAYMNQELAGGLNKPHQQFKKEYPGDNPMAVKENLLKEYKGFKAENEKVYQKKN